MMTSIGPGTLSLWLDTLLFVSLYVPTDNNLTNEYLATYFLVINSANDLYCEAFCLTSEVWKQVNAIN